MENQDIQVQDVPATTGKYKRALSNLPGMDHVMVIVSTPQLIKENSQYASTEKEK